MTELRERLRKARKANGFTQAKVASEIEGLSQPAYSDLESGKSKTTSKIAELARLFGVSAIWLATGQDMPDSTTMPATMPNAVGTVVRLVPIMERIQMSSGDFWEDVEYPLGYNTGYVYSQGASKDAYAVEGAGMGLYPAIRAGWILVFEPNQPPMPGEFVHIGLKNGKKAIREFISDMNGVVTVMSIDGSARITYHEEEVEFISAFRSMYPPSAVVRDVPSYSLM